ncbi:MAG: sulfatase/phosphatase domain-containing protein [Planctomycetota bacterium]
MQSRRTFLAGVGAGALALTLPGCGLPRREPVKRPNILFIMSDDHAQAAMGCYGSRINETPHLDRLAAGGAKFTQAYCTNAICGPSRASMLTGKYSHANGVLVNETPFDGSQPTFPRLLRQAGYQTAVIGKWHLSSRPSGFDHWCVLPGQGQYYNPDFDRMGERVRIDGYVTDIITDESLSWLEDRDREKPFCLLLHHKAPHRNWMPGPEHLNDFEDDQIPLPPNFHDDYATRSDAARSQKQSISKDLLDSYDLKLPMPPAAEGDGRRDEREMWSRSIDRMTPEQRAAWDAAYGPRNERFAAEPPEGRALEEWKYQRYIKDYLRCIASVDDSVGRVLDYLDREGLAEDTIVVYTSDQGFFLGEHGWFDKRFMYRESHGIPLIVRYPREVPAGVDVRHMALNVDFSPTFLDYADVRPPEGTQGESLRPVLDGAAPESWRRSVYYHYFEYPGSHGVCRHYGVRTSRYLLVHFYYDIDAWELYDLRADPAEMVNLYDDPAHAGIVTDLKAELARLREKYGDEDETMHLPKSVVPREHAAVGCPVVLAHAPHPKYTAGGSNALTDGRCGPDSTLLADYTAWQGFEEVDLDAVVDLGRPTAIGRLSIGCLQNTNSWIFLPTSVRFAVSDDGKEFREFGVVANEVSPRRAGFFRHEFALSPEEPVRARYVRVRAENLRACPDGHKGAGGKAWVFADEIVVE